MTDISQLEEQSQTYSDITELLEKLEASKVPTELKDEGRKMIVRVFRMAKKGSYSTEFESTSRYIDWVLHIPWETMSNDSLDLTNTNANEEKDQKKKLVGDIINELNSMTEREKQNKKKIIIVVVTFIIISIVLGLLKVSFLRNITLMTQNLE